MEKNDSLDWNTSGELIANGKVIPYSHITNLIKDAIVEHKYFYPVGIGELVNVPLTLIQNPERKRLLQQSRQVEVK